MRRSLYLGPAAAMLGLSCVTAASAQQSNASPATAAQEAGSEAPGTSQLDEVIVTARRREESLSKVPIEISAISSDSINSQSIRSESDLEAPVPGLTVVQAGSNNVFNYSIRGQSIDAYSASAPAVLPYIDEAQISSFSASTFYDLENIQVLKGPQGTLFGRNTTGGAIREACRSVIRSASMR